MALDPNWRKTPAGIKLGKMLFDGHLQSSIQNNPALLLSLMKAAGFDIPKGVEVSADVAQIIISGGAVITAVETGADWASVCQPSVSAVRACIALMELTGIMDPKSPMAQILTIAADVAMIVSSYGTNVLADVQFVMDCYSIYQSFEMASQIDAQKKLKDAIEKRTKTQRSALVLNLSDYHNNKIDIFTFIGKVAEGSPDYFESYFPNFGTFIPKTIDRITVKGTATSWWGDHSSYTKSVDIPTIVNDHKTVTTGIVMKYAGEPLSVFEAIKQNYKEKNFDTSGFSDMSLNHDFPIFNRISLVDMAALSLMPPYIQNIPPNFDIGPYLQNLHLSPSDFNFGLDEGVTSPAYFPDQLEVMLSSPIQFYPSTGIPISSQVVSKGQCQAQKNIIAWDNKKQISKIIANPIGKKIVKEWGTIPRFGANSFLGLNPLAAKFQSNLPRDAFTTLAINQLFSCLSYLNVMKKDKFFSDFDFIPIDIPGWSAEIEDRHKTLQLKSTARALNYVALENIAGFLNCPVSKLKRAPLEQGKLASYYAS